MFTNIKLIDLIFQRTKRLWNLPDFKFNLLAPVARIGALASKHSSRGRGLLQKQKTAQCLIHYSERCDVLRDRKASSWSLKSGTVVVGGELLFSRPVLPTYVRQLDCNADLHRRDLYSILGRAAAAATAICCDVIVWTRWMWLAVQNVWWLHRTIVLRVVDSCVVRSLSAPRYLPVL